MIIKYMRVSLYEILFLKQKKYITSTWDWDMKNKLLTINGQIIFLDFRLNKKQII
jgi:hypothetical protein